MTITPSVTRAPTLAASEPRDAAHAVPGRSVEPAAHPAPLDDAQGAPGVALRQHLRQSYPALFECPCLPPPRRQRFVEQMATAAAVVANAPSPLNWYDIGSGNLLHLATQAEALCSAGVRSAHFLVIERQPVALQPAEDFSRFLIDLSARSGGSYSWAQPELHAFYSQVMNAEIVPKPDVVTLVDPDRTSAERPLGLPPLTDFSISDRRSGIRLFSNVALAHQGLPLLADIFHARSVVSTRHLSEAQDRAESLVFSIYHSARRASEGFGRDSSIYFRLGLLERLPKDEFVTTWRDDPKVHLDRMRAIHPEILVGELTHTRNRVETHRERQ